MRHHPAPAACAVAALLAGACAIAPSSVAARSASQAGGPTLSEACEPFRNHPIVMWIDSPAVRQGETVPIHVGSTLRQIHPGVRPDPVPSTCLGDWRISPAGAAAVSDDGARLTVAADAPAGTSLTLSAQSPGGPVSREVAIIGRDEAVLMGLWSQMEVDCGDHPPPGRPVRELGFSADRFTVTWTPFESYTDYWGTYAHDIVGGRLRLQMTGSNLNPPTAVMEGGIVVSADGRRMVLTGIDLGDGQQWVPERRCRYEFGKISPAAAGRP